MEKYSVIKPKRREAPGQLEHIKSHPGNAAFFLRQSGSSKGTELIAVLLMIVYLELMKWGNNYSSALTYDVLFLETRNA